MIPQLLKILKEKKAEDISITMLIVLLSGLCLWIAYGIMRDDLPIIATNSFSVLINITIVVLRIKYSGTK